MSNGNWPIGAWQGAFDVDPTDGTTTPTWKDLSSKVTQYEVMPSGRQYESNTVETGTAGLQYDNSDESLTPANASSPYNTGGNLLLPYRRLRHWLAWPLTGNMITDANKAAWGLSAASASFEDGTVGGWGNGGTATATLVSSTTRATDGTHSLRATWPTSAASAPGVLSAALPIGPLRVGQTYTLAADVWVVAGGPTVKINVSGLNGSVTTTTGAWQRLKVSFVAASASHTLYLYPTAATTSGQQIFIDAVQLEFGATANTYSSSGPVIYPLFGGYIERYPETWDAKGFRGWQNLTAVDALAHLPSVDLNDVLSEVIELDGPDVAWSLADPTGTAYPVATGNDAGVVLDLVRNYSGDVASTPLTIGANPGPDIDGSTCLTFPAPVDQLTYHFAVASGIQVGSTSGTTMECWVRTTATLAQVFVSGEGFGFAEWALRMNASGQPQLTETDNGTTILYTATGVAPINDGRWHHVVGVETVSGSTVTGTLYVDGLVVASGTRSATGTFIIVGVFVGTRIRPYFTQPYQGDIARIAVYPGVPNITDHYVASVNGFAEETTGQRAARILSWMPWNGALTVDTGITPVQGASGLAGKTVADALNECATTENGALYADGTGALQFASRDRRLVQTAPAFTLGEQETPYLGDIGLEMDPSFLKNDITVTPSGLPGQNVTDATSQTRYFPKEQNVDTIHAHTADGLSLAQHMLNQYKDPHTRVSAVSLNPAANPTLWPVVLGLKFGQRGQVKRRTSAGVTYTVDVYVEKITHTVGPGAWITRLQLSPIPPKQAWIVGDSTYGVIGTTTIPTY